MSLAKEKTLEWVRSHYPFLFQVALEIEKKKQNIGFDFGSITGILTTIKDIAPSLIQADAQRKILKVQLKRAEKGWEPLDASLLMPGAVSAQPPLSQEREYEAKQVASNMSSNGGLLSLLLVGGLGLIAVMGFMKSGKR